MAVVDIDARQNSAKGNGSNDSCTLPSLGCNTGDLAAGAARAKGARRRRGEDIFRIEVNPLMPRHAAASETHRLRSKRCPAIVAAAYD